MGRHIAISTEESGLGPASSPPIHLHDDFGAVLAGSALPPDADGAVLIRG